MTDMSDNWRSWREAAARPGVDAALRDLYARLDDAVRAKGPTCWLSGRCCNFEAYGHRLYVTGLEIAWVLRQRGEWRAEDAVALDAGGCPFQVNKLCTAHAMRPLGCRVFFCQEGTDEWQHALYEQFLNELRQLHDAQGIAYRYMEWRAGMREAVGG